MVFVNEAWNGTGEIVVYSNYHKYWLDRERKIKNPLFDVFSGKILDLKAEDFCSFIKVQRTGDLAVCRNTVNPGSADGQGGIIRKQSVYVYYVMKF